jgi:hypothetical protein
MERQAVVTQESEVCVLSYSEGVTFQRESGASHSTMEFLAGEVFSLLHTPVFTFTCLRGAVVCRTSRKKLQPSLLKACSKPLNLSVSQCPH